MGIEETWVSAPKFSAVATLVLGVFTLGACGESESNRTNGGGASGTAGGGSTAVAGGVGGATGGMLSAGSGGSAAGAGGVAVGGGGGTAGQMADCLPPCLWSLFASCRPEQSCSEEHEAGTSDYLECEAATGYRFESHVDNDGSHPDPDMIVKIHGALCYTASHVGSTWTYSDPSGTTVATATYGTDGISGTCPRLDEPGSPPIVYRLDLSDPRCAPIDCTPGVCP